MANRALRVNGTLLLSTSPLSIARAASIICRGGLVAFPTETVYGLGAAVTNRKAINNIFRAKGRPSDNPLIVHLSSINQLKLVACNIPERAYLLAEKFWPGPLSLVLPKAEKIPDNISAGLDTVAVRMPANQTALELIESAGVPIAAPSANLSGRPSPTSYRHVINDLSGRIDAIIMDEACPIGVESTVLDLSETDPVILRPGGVTREVLEKFLGCRVKVSGLVAGEAVPVSPGMKYRHYAPNAPLILITGSAERRKALIRELFCYYSNKGFMVGLLNSATIHKNPPGKTEELAAGLYSRLRRMDLNKKDLIIAEEIENRGLGLAVMNRLRKAAARIIRVF